MTAGVEGYSTTFNRDNCLMGYYNYNVAKITTSISQTYAKCGFNLKKYIIDTDNWQDLMKFFIDYNYYSNI